MHVQDWYMSWHGQRDLYSENNSMLSYNYQLPEPDSSSLSPYMLLAKVLPKLFIKVEYIVGEFLGLQYFWSALEVINRQFGVNFFVPYR